MKRTLLVFLSAAANACVTEPLELEDTLDEDETAVAEAEVTGIDEVCADMNRAAVRLELATGQDQIFGVARSGRLQYKVQPSGGIVPDFSTAGYRGGGVAVPEIRTTITVEPSGGRRHR